MTHLSDAAKERLVLKASQYRGYQIKEIALANNIGYSTLLKWIKSFRDSGKISGKSRSLKGSHKYLMDVSLSQRFSHLMATASLDQQSLGVYCRKHGLFSHQLDQWKNDFMTENLEKSNKSTKANATEIKALKAENQSLKKELLRKDKALAEATALLILKKKAQLIWGETKEDS